jgi:DNA-directed RNA polymerase specialized sigma24 family protein
VAPPRPRTWDEADTRASVALARSDPAAPKTVRFGDYYVDPCVDLLMHRHRLDRERAEEIVQQFFCEMEEPLERGEHRGRAWKDALRERYDPARGSFRPYLRQALVNFARDWFRRDARPPRDDERPLDPLAEALERRGEWQPLLDAFLAAMTAARKDAARAAQVVHAVLAEGATQAELSARLGVSERTLRTDLRLGAELLRDWLEARLAALPADSDPVLASLVAGLPLVPEWLHRPTIEKRGRALLYLLLAQRRLGPAAVSCAAAPPAA